MEVLECPFEIATLFTVVLEDLQMTRLAGWLPSCSKLHINSLSCSPLVGVSFRGVVRRGA